MKPFFRLASVFLLSFMLATMVCIAVPGSNRAVATLAIATIMLCIPHQRNVLAMNGIEAREDFDNVTRIFNNAFNPRFVFDKKNGVWIPNPDFDPMWDAVSAFRLTQQTLRMEQPMVAGSNVYNFPILNNIQNQNQQSNTELRLAQQDTFVPTHIGFFLEYPDAENQQDAAFQLCTYPNQVLSTQPAQELAFYNGVLKIMVNNVQYTNNWDLWRHFKANQTQQTAALGAGSPRDQFAGDDDGFYAMQPFVLMIGSQNIQISITLPQNAPNAVSAGGRLCLMMRGVLGQQSTVVN